MALTKLDQRLTEQPGKTSPHVSRGDKHHQSSGFSCGKSVSVVLLFFLIYKEQSVRAGTSEKKSCGNYIFSSSANAAMSKPKTRYDYGRDFNARKYLQQYYKTDDDGKSLENNLSGYIFRKLNSIFDCCDKGKGRLLDIGTGPSIAYLIPASLKFHYIYCSDFTPGCRMELTMWCAGDTAAYEWMGYFKYAARLDQKADEWEDYEERLRNSIVAILPCDLMCSDPLTPEKLTPVDVMTASFAFSCAAEDYDDFENSMERMGEYLKTDGTLVLTEFLEGSWYIVDDEKFHICRLTEEDYLKALKYAGFSQFEISKASDANVSPDGTLTDAQDVIVIKATKNPPCKDVPLRADSVDEN